TGPSKTDFCGVDRRHSGSHTSGTRCGRDERLVARKRFGRHSSPIVPQMRGPEFSSIRLFSVQIVFGPNARYSMDSKGLVGLRKVLYRTLVASTRKVLADYAKRRDHRFGVRTE